MLTTNPDGSLSWDGSDGTEGVVKTGPVSGTVRLKDGTSYNVTPEFIESKAAGHGGRIAHHIALMHQESGRLEEMTGSVVHTCTEECGDETEV